MGIKVKYDIGTSVSIDVVIGKNPIDGSDVEQAQIYLPGAVLPPNVAPRVVEALKNNDPWLTPLLEFDGEVPKIDPAYASPFIHNEDAQVLSNPFAATSEVGDGDQPFDGSNAPVPANAPPAEAPAADPDPTGQVASSPFFDGVNAATPENAAPVDYDSLSKAELEAEVTRRRETRTIEVTGTGQNNGIKADDLRTALKADDAAQAATV